MSTSLYIATDRRNAFSWISRGLVLPPAFMDKYKQDAAGANAAALLVGDGEAAGRIFAASALPVVVELDADGLVVDVEPVPGVVSRVRGALSARRIVRLHLPDESERQEVAARAYRGFDGATLPLAVSPGLFPGVVKVPPEAEPGSASSADDRELRRREALVAGAATVLTERVAERVANVLLTDGGECWSRLVADLRRAGTVTSEADAALLREIGEVLIALPRGVEPPADDIVDAIRARLPERLLQEVETHLEWIAQLSRGEAALQPFKDRGGVRSAKALLLYLLRPTPEGVRTWNGEEQNAGPEVLDLAALFAGLVSGYGGLPAELRSAPRIDALLDWAASALRPSDVRPVPRAVSPSAAAVPAGDAAGGRAAELLQYRRPRRRRIQCRGHSAPRCAPSRVGCRGRSRRTCGRPETRRPPGLARRAGRLRRGARIHRRSAGRQGGGHLPGRRISPGAPGRGALHGAPRRAE